MTAKFARLEVARERLAIHRRPARGFTHSIVVILGLILLPACMQRAIAQNYLTSTGLPSFAAPQPVELGTVDESSGHLHLAVPLGSYPQRGSGQPQAITLEYDSNFWGIGDGALGSQWFPYNAPGLGAGEGGWYISYQANDQYYGYTVAEQGCYSDMSWADQNGTVHFFHLNASTNNTCPTTADAFATDSSGYHMYYAVGTYQNGVTTLGYLKVYAPDGTQVFEPLSQKDSQGHFLISEDTNGNYLSYANFGPVYDTLGRQIAQASFGAPVAPGSIKMMTSQGTSAWTTTVANINVNTKFGQSGVQESLPNMSITVIRTLTLPDAAGSTYQFTYDCDSSSGNAACGSPAGQSAYYGELIGITLPTGGTVSYSYMTFKDVYSNMSQWVSRRVAAGGTWIYMPSVPGSRCSSTQVNCQQQTTVTEPSGTQTVYTFQLNNGAWPTSVVQKDAAGNVLSTITNTWDMTQPCVMIGCHGNSFVRLTSQKTAISSAGGTLTKQVSYSYDSPQSGNQTAIKEWNYSSSGSFASVPDRATYIKYLSTGTNNINRPQSITLCNNSGSDTTNCPGGGSRVSQTLYTYDCYSGTGCSALTPVTGVAQHDDANFGASYTTRGNVTSVSRWVSGSTYLTTSDTYDTTGQVKTETDPAGNITTYGYVDNFYTDPGNDQPPATYAPSPATNAYITSVTDAIGTQTTGYYWGSGKVAVAKDYNTQTTNNHYQDGLDRQTEEIDPIGWQLATYSSATQSDRYSAIADASPSTGCLSCQHIQTTQDPWGRTSSQILVNSTIGQVEADSSFDANGRMSTQSHPHAGTGDPNNVLETYSYDPLNRQTAVKHPDGQQSQTAYGANVVNLQGAASQTGSTSTYGYGYPSVSEDESGKEKEQWTDGFGRVIEVDEPSLSGSLTVSPLVTNYLYDAADRLTQVIQGTQTRTFSYDGLGRKISETTPEGGTVTYVFATTSGGVCSGDPSNVCSRTDARGVVTTYTYDHASRITGQTYTIPSGKGIASMPNVCTTSPNSTQANVCYSYDQGGAAALANGRLTKLVDGTGSESYSHDAKGRLTQLSKVVNSQTYTIGYKYDSDDDVTQVTYPSGRVVQQAYYPDGQLCEIAPTATGCSDGTYYASGFSYNAPGKLTGFNYGNGVTATYYYSPDRTQLTYLAYTKGTATYFNLQYSYQKSSPYAPPCSLGTVGNNGSVECITDNVDSGRSTGFGYDSLKRMSSANTCGSSRFPKWGLSESLDRFGNRLSQTLTAGSGPQTSMSFNGNNQPTGYTYDTSGNMTVEPLSPPNNMTYDGENRMTTFSGNGGAASYSYDGNGTRVVRSVSGGTTTVSILSGSQVIAEYDNGAAPSSPSREYIDGPNGALAVLSGGTTTYYHQDRISIRLTTDANGNVLTQQGHYPFGESWYQSGPGNTWFFTSYDRDSESGLDYALARYYDSRTGTFCSADPLAGHPDDPQSWNRYPYGRNDPVDITDPSGKSWWSDALGLLAAPFTGGLSLFLDFTYDNVQAVVNNQNPTLPFFFGASIGGVLGGASPGGIWQDKWSVPYGGVTNGIQNALGLPTMADISPLFSAQRNPNAIDCDGYHYIDPLMGAVEFTAKIGPEGDVHLGPLKIAAGFSFYKNFSSGEMGGKAELKTPILGIEGDNKTPEGGSLNGGQKTEWSLTALGFSKNFTTHETKFEPSKSLSFGAQAILGFEFTLNWHKAMDIAAHNHRCGVDD